MVVFTCAHCGDSLQKPKVEKHYETKCYNKYPDVCCVDCLKDFRGDEFKSHTSCVTEAQRYGGKGYVAKENKGEKKQSAWIEIVQSVLEENKNLSGSLRGLLERVSSQPNTPRKQAKFFNFVKSMNVRAHPKDIERAWELLSAKLDLIKGNSHTQRANKNSQDSTIYENLENTNDVNNKENGIESHDDSKTDSSIKKKKKKDVPNNGNQSENNESIINGDALKSDEKTLTKKERKEKKKREKYESEVKQINNENTEVNPDKEERKSRKRKLKESEKIQENNEQEPIEANVNKIEPLTKKVKTEAESFNWVEAISSILGSRNKEISLKKLEKKVLTEFCATTNTVNITERINKKFLKALKKIDNVLIENEKVSISSAC